MEPAPDEPGPADARRLTVIGVIVSVAVHVALMIAVRWIAPERDAAAKVIDIDIAPMAPLAEVLPPEQEAPPEETAPLPAEDEVALPEPAPSTEEGMRMVDAGVPDAGVPDAPVDAPIDARIDASEERLAAVDAGVADADAGGEVAAVDLLDGGVADGGVPDDAGDLLLAVPDDGGVPDDGAPDGELLAAAADGGVGDDGGGVAVADAGAGDGAVTAAAGPASDGGVAGGLPGGVGDGGLGVGPIGPVGGADPTGVVGAKPSSGTAANLLNYFPRGHVVTVMVRLDRLRGTEWADSIDALLKPLPDHRSLVGDSDVRLADSFDLLVVSSPRPEDAVATTLLARTRMTPAELRDFLDQPDAPVAWSAVKGGALGRRGRSARVFHGDERVFLSWTPGWMVLTQPRDLGPLTTPRATGGLDRAARAIDLPPWLARAATISDESGEPTGPALMVTAANMFGADIPMIGPGGATVPAPEQATITLEIVDQGFLLKGNLRYADDSAAATAQNAIERFRDDLLDDLGSRFLLERVGAVNPLKNLSLRRTGRRIAFSTSASIAEARAMLAVVATFVTAHFEERRQQPVRRKL